MMIEEVFDKIIKALCGIFVIFLIMVIIAMLSSCGGDNATAQSTTKTTVIQTQIVKIMGAKDGEHPYVRSEPKVLNVNKGEYNFFGKTKMVDFTMEIPSVYKTTENLDENGDFYGLRVKDILATPEGEAWFPDDIINDDDGIVWINYKYIHLY